MRKKINSTANKKLQRLLGNESGMTLIEVLCSLAILSLVFLVMIGGFSTAGQLFNRSTDLKNEGQLAAGDAELGTPTESEEYTLTIEGVAVYGQKSTYSAPGEDGEAVNFYLFSPAGFAGTMGGATP